LIFLERQLDRKKKSSNLLRLLDFFCRPWLRAHATFPNCYSKPRLQPATRSPLEIQWPATSLLHDLGWRRILMSLLSSQLRQFPPHSSSGTGDNPGTVWVPFKMLRERLPMLSAMTLDQLGAKMRCDKCGKRPERYYPANQSDTPGFAQSF
jgi:hypothetical protein